MQLSVKFFHEHLGKYVTYVSCFQEKNSCFFISVEQYCFASFFPLILVTLLQDISFIAQKYPI